MPDGVRPTRRKDGATRNPVVQVSGSQWWFDRQLRTYVADGKLLIIHVVGWRPTPVEIVYGT